MQTHRDYFLNQLFEEAKKDNKIVIISPDFGAPALDQFREQLPNQFFHGGISEQNVIDVAAGMALSGYKVYIYCMAPFITLRCLEQIKCSISMMKLGINIISTGVGLSYADAGPTHYITEDFACIRSLHHANIFSASDLTSMDYIFNETLNNKKFNFIRLERDPVGHFYSLENIQDGYRYVLKSDQSKKILITYGHNLNRVINHIKEKKIDNNFSIIELIRIKPLPLDLIDDLIENYYHIHFIEEHNKEGGLASAILEEINSKKNGGFNFKHYHLIDDYIFENGGREYLLNKYGLNTNEIVSNILSIN